MLDPTGIDLGNTSLIFWEVITFAILLFLLVRYVYPPIRKQIEQRQAEIERSIDEAEKTRAEARELLAEYRRQIEEARGEGRQILEDARKQAEAQRERTKREAREEGDRIIQRAREEIDRERESAVREVRREVADMVVQASEQVIGRSIDRDEHERLISQALDDLEAEMAERRDRLSAVSTYAGALFEAAEERRARGGPLRPREFVAALHESEELRLFFYGGQIPERQKRRAIDGLTEGMKTQATNFLKVLVDNGREEILEEVLGRYEQLVKEHLGRIEVGVTTAVELSQDQLDRLKERLEGRSKAKRSFSKPT